MLLFPPWRLAQLRAMNTANLDITVTFRRGSGAGATTHGPQPARMEERGGAQGTFGTTSTSAATAETHADVLLIGTPEMDVEARDLFNVAGALYRVVRVRPSRVVSTVCECVVTG